MMNADHAHDHDNDAVYAYAQRFVDAVCGVFDRKFDGFLYEHATSNKYMDDQTECIYACAMSDATDMYVKHMHDALRTQHDRMSASTLVSYDALRKLYFDALSDAITDASLATDTHAIVTVATALKIHVRDELEYPSAFYVRDTR